MSAKFTKKGIIVFEKDLLNFLGTDKFSKVCRTFQKTVRLDQGRFIKVTLVNKYIYKGHNYFVLPRGMALFFLQNKYLREITSTAIIENRVILGQDDVALTPYNYQLACSNYVCDNFLNQERASKGVAGAILEVEAGLGKTFIAADIFRKLQVKTLYIVPNEYLLEQAADDFAKCFPKLKIGKYYYKIKQDGDIVFMIINSALSEEFTLGKDKFTPEEFMSRFNLSIWDEVHEYASKERSVAFARVNTKYIFGMTAEANSRLDKLDFVCHYNIGPVIQAVNIPGFEVPDNDRYVSSANIIEYYGPKEYCQHIMGANGMMSAFKMSCQVIRDAHRMKVIVDQVKSLYAEGRNIFIWCDARNIVIIIRNLLRDVGIDSDMPEETKHLMGGVTKPEIQEAQNSRIIVATYQYAYRGVSLPKFDTMIFATPRRAHIYQTLKRIFRMGGNVEVERKIIDIVDMRTNLRYQLSSRMEQYQRDIFGMKITRQKIRSEHFLVPKEFSDKLKELCAILDEPAAGATAAMATTAAPK
jgi:hypothetical protein